MTHLTVVRVYECLLYVSYVFMEYDNVENYCNETVSRCNHTLAVNSLYTPAYSLLLTKLNSKKK